MNPADEAHDAEHVRVSSPQLLDALEALGREYGPLGVAMVAARLAGPEAVAERLGVAAQALADGDTLTAAAAMIGRTRRADRGPAPDNPLRREPPVPPPGLL